MYYRPAPAGFDPAAYSRLDFAGRLQYWLSLGVPYRAALQQSGQTAEQVVHPSFFEDSGGLAQFVLPVLTAGTFLAASGAGELAAAGADFVGPIDFVGPPIQAAVPLGGSPVFDFPADFVGPQDFVGPPIQVPDVPGIDFVGPPVGTPAGPGFSLSNLASGINSVVSTVSKIAGAIGSISHGPTAAQNQQGTAVQGLVGVNLGKVFLVLGAAYLIYRGTKG